MSKERLPEQHRAWLARPFGAATRLVLAYPVATLALAVAVAAATLFVTYTGLGYRTSRLDLVNPDSDHYRRWVEYIEEFGDEDDVVIVVEGADRDHVVPVLRELSAQLGRENRYFHAVLDEVDLAKVRAKGLHYLAPDDLGKLEAFVARADQIVRGDWTQLNVGRMASRLAEQLAAEQGVYGKAEPTASVAELDRLAGSLVALFSTPGEYRSPWPAMPASFATLSELNSEYLLMREGRLGFVLLRMSPAKDSFEGNSAAADALRELIARTSARHPEVQIGLTGLPIMENDEMRTANSAMLRVSLLSFVGVGLLIVAGFGGLRHAVLANVVLLLGMAWAFGYATLSVGHLNIFSVSFTVSMIGIGIDYGIHYIARYFEIRERVASPADALVATSTSISPAITTGALTSAIAFFAAGMTEFVGIAELGIIAGGGLLLCAVSQLFVLPAAIYLMDRSSTRRSMPRPLPVETWLAPLMKAPRLLSLTTLAVTALLSIGIGRLWYDHNLLNMQAEGLESVELERRLLAECNQSVWFALSIADSREELLARKAEFLALPTVERTEEIASLLTVDSDVKRPVIVRLEQRLATLPERPPLVDVSSPEELGRALAEAQQLVGRSRHGAECAHRLGVARDLLRGLPAASCYELVSRFQQHMAGDLLSRLHMLSRMANPEPPQLTDLPASLVKRFVGQHGQHLLKVYGRGSIWDMDALEAFVHDVRSVDARVTGNPVQAYEAAHEMKRSYEQAACYALAVIIVVLLFDFRSLRFALLAAFPLGLGMTQMFGLMGLLDIPLNPANMIALPLILGLGVDYGVHVVHDYLDRPGRYRMSRSTAVAVLIDALTTIVGFGALMIASHQGVQSLGRVLVIGIACCTFSSLVILPALLTCFPRRTPEADDDATRTTNAAEIDSTARRRDAAHAAPASPRMWPVRDATPKGVSTQR